MLQPKVEFQSQTCRMNTLHPFGPTHSHSHLPTLYSLYDTLSPLTSPVQATNLTSDFAAWVKANEPGTLSYLLLARPASKKSNQLIMFERYDGVKSLGVHGGGKEFKGML
jgi:hypothetical protein